uniref:LIM zinc-binding domain-containing protein n=2 Tax=Tetranychus urticae TaxID=32264 RepID=T1L1L5_TETUR
MSDLPGGVITTHCVSTVVRPGSKQNHDPLQFVKIQSTELSQKAVEQIRLAEGVKITKEKNKEVEEEWRNNFLNWKSKRRQSRLTGGEESDSGDNQQRKIKTFSEILNEKAKSGQRIGYNLHKYIGINGLQVTQTPIQTVQQGQLQPQPTQQSQQQSPSHGPLQLAQPLQSQQLHQQQQQQKQMLSVSGKKKCSNCGDELGELNGRGCAAMVIETLALYYHINCFRCSVCHIQLEMLINARVDDEEAQKCS